jgi:hypothetical protein
MIPLSTVETMNGDDDHDDDKIPDITRDPPESWYDHLQIRLASWNPWTVCLGVPKPGHPVDCPGCPGKSWDNPGTIHRTQRAHGLSAPGYCHADCR